MAAVEVVKGKVNKIWQDTPKRFAFSVGKQKVRVSGFGKCPYQQGQEVEVEYQVVEKNGKTFNNLVQKKAPLPEPSTSISKDQKIARAVAWKVAAQLSGNQHDWIRFWSSLKELQRKVESDLLFKGED